MQFEKGYIYHIYNQGNDHQKVFFERENYLFFLKKVRKHILPYADVMAYCLMPNHFHFMVLVNEVELPSIDGRLAVSTETRLGVFSKHAESDQTAINGRLGVSSRHAEYGEAIKYRTINSSIGIMLMGYTKALNKQRNRSGKLFREETKAECVNCPDGITPSFYNTEFGTLIHVSNPEKEYPQACFNYIHQNPVKAGMVDKPEDWEFSSAIDYAGLRGGTLVNKVVAAKYVRF